MVFPAATAEPAKPAEKPAEVAQPAVEPVEAAKLEPQDQPDSVPAEIKSSKGAENWKRLRQERDNFLKERDEYKKQIDTLGKQPKTAENTADLDALRKERDEYSERLRVLGIERHPKFEAHFANRTASVIGAIKASIGGEQGETIAKILALPDSANRKAQLSEAMQSMDPVDASYVGAALLDIHKINGERNAEIERAKNDFTKIQEGEKLQQQQRVQQLNKSFDAELEKAKTIEFLQAREGDDEWNNGVKQLVDHSRNIFNGSLTEAEAARASLWAAVGPMYKQANAALSSKVASLEAENKSLRSATPAPGGGADPNTAKPVVYKSSIEAIVDQATNNGFVKKTA